MSSGNTISVVCDCGKKLKAPAAAAGKRARCPACGEIHVLPKAQEPELELVEAPAAREAVAQESDYPSEASSPPEEDDLLGAMYDLAHQENTAPARASGVVCPQCYSPMQSGAVLCLNCGYDTRTGKSAAAVAAPAQKSVIGYAGKQPAQRTAKNKKDYMAPDGSLALGIVFSAVFALGASLLWIAVAYFTGYVVGYIAILMGVAAGIGMQVGHKGQSQVGGMISGAMTLIAILVAKVVVLYAVMAKMGVQRSMFDIDSAKLGMYFFSPKGLIFMAIGVAAGYRCASGSMRD